MTDLLFSVFISSNIFPLLVVVASFIGYALYAVYAQVKVEIKEEELKHKGKI
jgi:hypothetical protein